MGEGIIKNDMNKTLNARVSLCVIPVLLIITGVAMAIGSEQNTTITQFTLVPSLSTSFDTGQGEYPSISGVHKGIITPFHNVKANALYTYPCSGTGGHTEYARFENATWNATATWEGYVGDWHNITFDKTVILLANEEYYYTIRTGSYPQIHHNASLLTINGWINCTEFVDVNGKVYKDWIPCIKLYK